MTKSLHELEQKKLKSQVQKYSKVASRYKKYAEILQLVLGKVVKKYAPEALVQVRAKSVASFAAKVPRKIGNVKDPVNEFTDLCGARIITTTPSEVEAVCRFMN